MPMDEALYKELIGLVELQSITVVESSASRGKGFGKQLPEVKVNISRGIAEPRISNQTVCIPVGYQVRIGKGNTLLLKFQVIFDLIFSTSNESRIQELLQDSLIKEFFTGYQADKIAWSYLRSQFAFACCSAGLQSITLPLLR